MVEVFSFNNEKAKENFPDSIQIRFLRNYTLEGITPYLSYLCYESQLNPTFKFGGYGTFVTELMSGQVEGDDIIVLSLIEQPYFQNYRFGELDIDAIKDDLQSTFELLRENSAQVIINTFLEPLFPEYGVSNLGGTEDKRHHIRELNRFIQNYQREHQNQFYCFDFNRYMALLGEQRAITYKNYYTKKSFFSNDFLSLYAHDIATTVNALKGKAKKCLVLDCDNTLWGGIVGEDGIDGIKIDPQEYPGNIFYQFQLRVLSLYNRGILIALASKNNEEDVFNVLDNHPHCLIKREHLASHRINWNNKADNILSMQEELNIGIDSFVFVDDNPSECELVRQAVPEVEVLQVPEKLHDYPEIVLKTGWFDGLRVSSEDKNRTQLYQQESKRKGAAKRYSNLNDFYKSLEIEIEISEATEGQLPRVAQLTQKTNQFNLTTIRYSAAQIEQMNADENCRIYCLSVKDKFGDLGNTGVLIAQKEQEAIVIDSFLLSCRILGKNIEKAFVYYCLENLKNAFNQDHFVATYSPTKKNRQTELFWEQVGLSLVEENEGGKRYELKGTLADKLNEIDYIKIN